jgi:hypothetical protein
MIEKKELEGLLLYYSLECANKYKFAIPNIVAQNILIKYPNEDKKELILQAIEVCKKVNKMTDKEINEQLDKIKSDKNAKQ